MITRSGETGIGDTSPQNTTKSDFSEPASVGTKKNTEIAQLALASEELLPKIQTALASGRADAVSRLANLLKGAARRADCTQVYNIAALLESMGVSEDLGSAQVTLAMLRRELEKAL